MTHKVHDIGGIRATITRFAELASRGPSDLDI
jgi:hypothetical protein